MPGWALLVVIGVVAMGVALTWFQTAQRAHDRARFEADVACAMGRERGTFALCDEVTANYLPQILLGAGGVFAVLLGVIVYAGRRG